MNQKNIIDTMPSSKNQRKYVVEKNVPMPSRGVVGGARNVLRELRFGESFAVPAEDIGYVRASIVKIQREGQRKFTCRKVDGGGYRVWCVEEAA